MLRFSRILSPIWGSEDIKSKQTILVSACLLHKASACMCLEYYAVIFSPLSLIPAPSLCWFMTPLVNLLINGCTGKAWGLFWYFFAWIPSFSYVCLQWLLPYNELMLAPIGVKYCSSSDHSTASALNSFVIIIPQCGQCVRGCTKSLWCNVWSIQIFAHV